MSSDSLEHLALVEAVRIAGSQTALAQICGVGQPTVSKWLDEKKPLDGKYCIAVEAATGVSRYRLNQQVYPPEPPASPSPDAGDLEPAR